MAHPVPITSNEYSRLADLITAGTEVVEKVFLLGSTGMQRQNITIFHTGQPACSFTAHYFVLVLAATNDARELNNLRDSIEARSQQWIPVTAIVLAIDAFTSWLRQGHLFASWVVADASLVYDNHQHVLPEATPVDEEASHAEHCRLLNHTRQKVQSFLAGAELYRIRKDYRLAAFMLHQAAEQQLNAMLVINTGLRVNTHSIERLIRYNVMWCDALTDLFPRQNERSQRLFTQLQRAYIDGRYASGYTVSFHDLEALEAKVKELVALLSR